MDQGYLNSSSFGHSLGWFKGKTREKAPLFEGKNDGFLSSNQALETCWGLVFDSGCKMLHALTSLNLCWRVQFWLLFGDDGNIAEPQLSNGLAVCFFGVFNVIVFVS